MVAIRQRLTRQLTRLPRPLLRLDSDLKARLPAPAHLAQDTRSQLEERFQLRSGPELRNRFEVFERAGERIGEALCRRRSELVHLWIEI